MPVAAADEEQVAKPHAKARSSSPPRKRSDMTVVTRSPSIPLDEFLRTPSISVDDFIKSNSVKSPSRDTSFKAAPAATRIRAREEVGKELRTSGMESWMWDDGMGLAEHAAKKNVRMR